MLQFLPLPMLTSCQQAPPSRESSSMLHLCRSSNGVHGGTGMVGTLSGKRMFFAGP